MRILIIMPNNLGDIMMTLPATSALKSKFPKASVTFFVEKGFEDALIDLKSIDNIVLFDRVYFRSLIAEKSVNNILSEFRNYIENTFLDSYDLLFNFCQHKYVSYLVSLIKADKKYGKVFLREGNESIKSSWSVYFNSIPFDRRANLLHSSDIFRLITGCLEGKSYSVEITKDMKDKSHELLSRFGICSFDRLMVFQPGSAFPSKIWNRENFVKLGRMLLEDGWKILVTGAGAEVDDAEFIASQIGEFAVSTAGKTSFTEAVSLLSVADAIVTGDTALMHAAAFLGVQVYSLFGATNPIETGPYSSGNIVFTTNSCSMSPCFSFECPLKSKNQCLNSITPEDVFSSIKGRRIFSDNVSVFKTGFKNGYLDYLPIVGTISSLYEKDIAETLFEFFSGEVTVPVSSLIDSFKLLANILKSMEALLDEYLNSREIRYITEFESLKSDVTKIPGIGNFMAAYVNITLNSIPLLSPNDGLKKSFVACRNILDRVDNFLERV